MTWFHPVGVPSTFGNLRWISHAILQYTVANESYNMHQSIHWIGQFKSYKLLHLRWHKTRESGLKFSCTRVRPWKCVLQRVSRRSICVLATEWAPCARRCDGELPSRSSSGSHTVANAQGLITSLPQPPAKQCHRHVCKLPLLMMSWLLLRLEINQSIPSLTRNYWQHFKTTFRRLTI